MESDNPSGADNQQERPSQDDWLNQIPIDLGNWITGFVEGEGSFNVPVRREHDRAMPWRVSLSFNVSQVGSELPELLKSTFGVGTVRDRGDGVCYFEVTKPRDLSERVFPFFERFPLLGPKKNDLAIFRQVTELVQSGRHRTLEGLREALLLRGPMNRGGKRRRTDRKSVV